MPSDSVQLRELDEVGAWDVLANPRRENWWVRARRYGLLAVVLVLVLAGAVSILGTIRGFVVRSGPSAAPPQVLDDSVFTAAALPFAVDYLSWDSADTAGGSTARTTALARASLAGATLDGWDGSGIEIADSPVVLAVARQDSTRAVVTVRVRVTPYTAGRPGTTPPAQDHAPAAPNAASGPGPGAAGTPGQPRWVNLAVPVLVQDGRAAVTAAPALVGSPPAGPAGPAVRGGAGGDSDYADATRDTITTLMRSYGSGDLQFVRAAGTTFSGLDGAASLVEVTGWQVAPVTAGQDGATRAGDVTVTWQLPDNGGKLRCSYRVELRNDTSNATTGDTEISERSTRWYLLSVGAEIEGVG